MGLLFSRIWVSHHVFCDAPLPLSFLCCFFLLMMLTCLSLPGALNPSSIPPQERLLSKLEMRILMVGLDAAGKVSTTRSRVLGSRRGRLETSQSFFRDGRAEEKAQHRKRPP